VQDRYLSISFFRYYTLSSPTSSFQGPISCTYFSYGPREPQSKSIWKTHLNFQEYVTDNIIFWYISNKTIFYLLLYLCAHKFLSSTILNINKLCLFNLNIIFFVLEHIDTYMRDGLGKNINFEHSKIDYIVSTNKWDSRGHMSFTAWYHLCFMFFSTSSL
jgi:hypothetical protein